MPFSVVELHAGGVEAEALDVRPAARRDDEVVGLARPPRRA
jgi:hypothetical protein